jgi:hypothetical protein
LGDIPNLTLAKLVAIEMSPNQPSAVDRAVVGVLKQRIPTADLDEIATLYVGGVAAVLAKERPILIFGEKEVSCDFPLGTVKIRVMLDTALMQVLAERTNTLRATAKLEAEQARRQERLNQATLFLEQATRLADKGEATGARTLLGKAYHLAHGDDPSTSDPTIVEKVLIVRRQLADSEAVLAKKRLKSRRFVSQAQWPQWPQDSLYHQMKIFPEPYSAKSVKCEHTRLPIGGLPSGTPFMGCRDEAGKMFAMTGKADGGGSWRFFWYLTTFVDGNRTCLRDLDTFLTGKRGDTEQESLDFDLVRTTIDGIRWYRGHRPFETFNEETREVSVHYQLAAASEKQGRCTLHVCLEGLDLFASPWGANLKCMIGFAPLK